MYADRLAEEQRAAGDLSAMQAAIADAEGQIRSARERLIGLKAQLLRNDETTSRMLNMVVAGVGGK